MLCPCLQGRLNELMSQIRMHTQIPGSAGSEGRYTVDPPLMADVQQVRVHTINSLLLGVTAMLFINKVKIVYYYVPQQYLLINSCLRT